MNLKGRSANLIDMEGNVTGSCVINDENMFMIKSMDKIFRFNRFDIKAFNIFNETNTFIGVLRESSTNYYNLIVNNKVIGFIRIN